MFIHFNKTTTDCKFHLNVSHEFYHREILRPIGSQIDKTHIQ